MAEILQANMTRDTIKLLRIPFSLFLMPVYLIALSQANHIHLKTTIISFFIIHLLVYPASNGYNSYIDKDETSIGGLEHPPMPGKQLFYVTAFMDFLAVILGALFINLLFSALLLLYIIASRAYSAPQPRLKKFAVIGFLVVVIFQGAVTFLMSLVAVTDSLPVFNWPLLFILFATSFQIAGAYPLTQIYQHEADKRAGIITISYRLGTKGTFGFTAAMFALSNLFYFFYFSISQQLFQFYLLQLFFLPVVIFFTWWCIKVLKNTKEANFKNTMRMNLIASVSMSSCFIVILVLKYFL